MDTVNESAPVAAPASVEAAPAVPEVAAGAATSTNAYLDSIKMLKTKFEEFVAEAEKGYDNKAASGRARKLSLALRKDLQEWREICLANDKVAK